MLIPVSKLESIVFSKAFLSSMESNIRNEINVDKIIDFTVINISPNNIVISSILLIAYGQFMYFQGQNNSKNQNNYDKIPKYQNFRNKLRFITTVFLILLVKDIQSVQ
jgi:hypothetical protein